jgi:hypothetical protein
MPQQKSVSVRPRKERLDRAQSHCPPIPKHNAKEQKFFASFFQKRSSSFLNLA